MKLKDLGKKIRDVYMVDDILKIYCYNDKINFVDYTSEYESSNGEKIKACYGNILTLGIKNNKITYAENPSIGFITKSNKNTIIYIANLIGLDIEDYDQYPKLFDISDIKELNCIDITYGE